MWWKDREACQLEQPENMSNVVVHSIRSKTTPRTHGDKFCKAAIIGKEIAEILSVCGETQYISRYSVLQQLVKFWCDGKEVVVLPIGTTLVHNTGNNFNCCSPH